MEQRNGRIDRKLQRSPVLNCYYFVYLQRPEDRVLQVLIRKTEIVQQELGSLSPVIDARLSRGIKRADVDKLAKEIQSEKPPAAERQSVTEGLESVRERRDVLSTQLEDLQDILSKS
jgi:hypothetical protein